MKLIIEKLKESALSVLPVSAIMLLLGGIIFRMPFWMLMLFFVGVLLIYIGMFAFSIGIDMSIVRMGEVIGSELTKSRKIMSRSAEKSADLLILCGFLGAIWLSGVPSYAYEKPNHAFCI